MRTTLLLIALALAAGGVATQPATGPSGTDWPAFHGGGAMLGVAPDAPSPPLKVLWTYRTNDKERAGVDGGAVIVGNSVYVVDNKGTVHAIELATGKARWKTEIEDTFETPPLVLGGRVIVCDMSGVVHALNAVDGKKLWEYKSDGPMHAGANGVGDRVLIANDQALIGCLEAATGKVLWTARAGDRVNSAPTVANGLVYAAGCDSAVTVVSLEDGKEKLSVGVGAVAPGSAAVTGDRFIVGTDGGKVVCKSLEGKDLWTYEGVEGGAMVFGTPAVAEGLVVVGARDQAVHAIDLASGKGQWKFQTNGDVDGSVAIAAGRVYVCSRDRRLYVLDLKTGKELWQYRAAGSLGAGPALTREVVVIADSSGNVVCLGPNR